MVTVVLWEDDKQDSDDDIRPDLSKSEEGVDDIIGS